MPVIPSWSSGRWRVSRRVQACPPPGDTSLAAPSVAAEVMRVHEFDARNLMVTSFNSSTLDLDEAETRTAEVSLPPPRRSGTTRLPP